jgi:Lar family restriction alleviation protein
MKNKKQKEIDLYNLKKCPFCGSGNLDFVVNYIVTCITCSADGPKAQSAKTAVSMWNLRSYGYE